MTRFKLWVPFTILFASTASIQLRAQADLQQQLIATDRALFEVTAGDHPDATKYEQMLAPDYIDVEFGRSSLSRRRRRTSQDHARIYHSI